MKRVMNLVSLLSICVMMQAGIEERNVDPHAHSIIIKHTGPGKCTVIKEEARTTLRIVTSEVEQSTIEGNKVSIQSFYPTHNVTIYVPARLKIETKGSGNITTADKAPSSNSLTRGNDPLSQVFKSYFKDYYKR